MTDLKLFRVTLFVVALLAVTGGWAQQSAPTPRDEALHFIRNETQFHLGYLPTEQSHPKTRGLSQALQTDGREVLALKTISAAMSISANSSIYI